MKTFRDLGPKAGVIRLRELCLSNIANMLTILKWNEAHGIRLYRMASGLFPHSGNPEFQREYPSEPYFRGNIDFARDELAEVGAYARRHGHRLTFHSTPYFQLGTPDREVLRHTLVDLALYNRVFDLMGIADRIIIAHGGGVHGSKEASLRRIETVLGRIRPQWRNSIVFENDERHYGINDLLPFAERVGAPFCLDIFHNAISADHVPINMALLERVVRTWHGRIPKFHISEQEPGGRFGAHSEYVRSLPGWLFNLPRQVGIPRLDIMVECKMKEQSVLVLQQRYFDKMGAKKIEKPKAKDTTKKA